MKALPQPSKAHGETICCAGVTADGKWKRLFPVRFRHLTGNSFKRWDWVEFKYSRPTHDSRAESCKVHEESLKVVSSIPKSERSKFLSTLILPSIKAAIDRKQSLALIRPVNPRFIYKRKSPSEIQQQREAFKKAASQTSMLDKELEALEPTPFEFRFKFEDGLPHNFDCGDWEAHAMFWLAGKRGLPEKEALEWMDHKFNVEYPNKGMVFAIGNQAKRPHIWQLLGVLRVDDLPQASFGF